jgi:class 3 adenylate cyclase
VYHSGYFPDGSGIQGFLADIAAMGKRKNLYAELGSTFAAVFLSGGATAAAHLVGSLLKALGPKRIVWGTDSIWWGSPQWQLDVFKTLTIPPALQEEFGYPALTDRIKRRILGDNAARLYGIRRSERRCEIDVDRISEAQREVGRPLPLRLRSADPRAVRRPAGPRGLPRRHFERLAARPAFITHRIGAETPFDLRAVPCLPLRGRVARKMNGDGQAAERERGFLLIADMEASTESKLRLGEEGAFAALREHNRRVIEHCRKAQPVPGAILNSLGDAVVAKFPAEPEPRSAHDALASCLGCARAIVETFEALPPLSGPDAEPFPLRTKLTLQFYDAFLYGRREQIAGLAEELVGPDIDVAFRLEPISWRLQVLAAERFVEELLRHSDSEGQSGRAGPRELIRAAHAAREAAAGNPGPAAGLTFARRLAHPGGNIDFWITDAREVARLKGIEGTQRLFLIGFEPPEALAARGERARLTIKVRQDHHAIVLAGVSLAPGQGDDYVEYVLETVGDEARGSQLESELTLYAAAKIYGEFDFFFRVSCIDDDSLRRFFEAIQSERFGVRSVEVRSTVADRFYVTPHYERIARHFQGSPHELVLTWFSRDPESDLFLRFVYRMEEGPGERVRPVEIIEAGEVIHHRPVYAIFLCESLAAYADFFVETGLSPTACRSHIGQATRPGDVRLRYGLMTGVWIPPRRRLTRADR